jgi:hypothetical protein
MTDQPPHRNVEIVYGNRVVTSAYVSVSPTVSHTVRASVHARSGHLPAGSRTNLIDAILDLPEVQASAHLEVTVPLGDAESIQRIAQRTYNMTTRAAGASALIDADCQGLLSSAPRGGHETWL